MSKRADSSDPVYDRAIKELIEDVNIEKAETTVTYWFRIAAEHDDGADIEDIKCFTALINFLRKLR